MCYEPFHRRRMTALEKDPRRYIGERFRFLQERGYRLQYWFKNGENEFFYDNSRSEIFVFYDDRGEVACTIAFGDDPRRTRKFAAFLDEALRAYYEHLSPQDKIDFLAGKTKEILEELAKQGFDGNARPSTRFDGTC